MSFVKSILLTCDGIECDNEHAYDSDDLDDARSAAAHFGGWDYDVESDEDFCSTCKEA